MTTLAERLKQARLARNKSQTEVAKAVGMKQPSYNAIESGKVQRSGFLTDIAQFLSVDPTWLATGQGQMIGAYNSMVINGDNNNHGMQQIGTQHQYRGLFQESDVVGYLSQEQQKAVISLAQMANISPAEWVGRLIEKELVAIRQAVDGI